MEGCWVGTRSLTNVIYVYKLISLTIPYNKTRSVYVLMCRIVVEDKGIMPDRPLLYFV